MVGEISAVCFLMTQPSTLLNTFGIGVILTLGHGVPVPLSVSQLSRQHRRIRRYRVRSPMNKDAELGIAEPVRCRPFVERLPCGLIILSANRDNHEETNKTTKQPAFHGVSSLLNC